MYAYAFVFSVLLIFKVGGASSKSYGGKGAKSFVSGSSYFGSSGKGAVAYNGAAISVVQNNGKTEVSINGKPVDLDRATVLEENDQYKVLEPAGIPGARIKINKANGQLAVEYGGAHYQTVTPEAASAQLSEAIQGMEEELHRMHGHLNKLFQGFPFEGPWHNFQGR